MLNSGFRHKKNCTFFCLNYSAVSFTPSTSLQTIHTCIHTSFLLYLQIHSIKFAHEKKRSFIVQFSPHLLFHTLLLYLQKEITFFFHSVPFLFIHVHVHSGDIKRRHRNMLKLIACLLYMCLCEFIFFYVKCKRATTMRVKEMGRKSITSMEHHIFFLPLLLQLESFLVSSCLFFCFLLFSFCKKSMLHNLLQQHAHNKTFSLF